MTWKDFFFLEDFFDSGNFHSSKNVCFWAPVTALAHWKQLAAYRIYIWRHVNYFQKSAKQEWKDFQSHRLRNEWQILQNDFQSLIFPHSTRQDDKIMVHCNKTTDFFMSL